MLTKIIPLLLLAALSSSVQALSLSIPKLAIDHAVSSKFPKEKFSVTLESPTTKFIKETQKIELCGKWSTKLPQKTGDFCIDFRPVWNKTKGDVEISKVNILKLTMEEDKNIPKAVETTLNNSLLFLLDGTSVYHAPDMIGKRMNNIEVQVSSFQLVF
jgi:hypothetical protein